MFTDIDKDMMLRYLEKSYPVSRIKHNLKFRRAIVLETGVYVLGDKENHNNLKLELFRILKIVFSCDDDFTKSVLKNFLNLD